MFNNLYVIRTDADDKVLSQIKVPLSYSPRRKYLERIEEMNNGEDLERQLAVKLPRMSFEIIGFQRDDQRLLGPGNNIAFPGSGGSKARVYTGVPYLINFQLNILSKNHDDALQVVEQIVPFFRPQMNQIISPIVDYPEFKETIPVVMQSVTFMDDYEGAVEQRRTIIYTLDFEMKLTYYGPTDQLASTISQVDGRFFDYETRRRLETVRVTPSEEQPSEDGVSTMRVDDDFGFDVEIIPGNVPDGGKDIL